MDARTCCLRPKDARVKYLLKLDKSSLLIEKAIGDGDDAGSFEKKFRKLQH